MTDETRIAVANIEKLALESAMLDLSNEVDQLRSERDALTLEVDGFKGFQTMLERIIEPMLGKALDTFDFTERVESVFDNMPLYEGIAFDAAVDAAVEAALSDATIDVEVEARILT